MVDIDYRDFETVRDLLEYVCKLKGWNPDNLRVTYRGEALRNDMKLTDLKLEKGDKLIIVSKVVGCQKLKLEERGHNK
jgi:uncharacterized ubiquitin-like protein YukD